MPRESRQTYMDLQALQDLARGSSRFEPAERSSVADLLEKDKEKLLALLTWGLAAGPGVRLAVTSG